MVHMGYSQNYGRLWVIDDITPPNSQGHQNRTLFLESTQVSIRVASTMLIVSLVMNVMFMVVFIWIYASSSRRCGL